MNNTFITRIRFIRALQSRQFTLLWIGQTISRLGDGAYLTALAWQVLLLTGSGTAMGIVLLASSLPQVIFLLAGGLAADRLPKRLVLLWSDGGRAVAVLLIAGLGWLHILQLWHLIALSLCFGVAQGFFFPTYQAIQAQLVEVDALPSANALTGLSQQLGQLLGPLLGAWCVALAGPTSAFALDGLSFTISALCILALSNKPVLPVVVMSQHKQDNDTTKEHPQLRGVRGMVADVREGLAYVTHWPWLWVTILIASLGNIGLAGPLQVSLPRLIHDVYRAGVWLLGTVGTANALGAIAGTLVIGQIHHLHRRGLLAYLGIMLSGVGLIMLGLPLPHGNVAIMAFVASMLIGAGIGIFSVIWVTVLQELVPADKLGRVFSIDALGSYCLLPVGYALAGILTDHIGPAQVFIAGGILNIVLCLIALSVPGVRRLD